MSAARLIVKQWLFLIDPTGWLAFAKIAMGTPLTILTVLVVIWAFRRATKRLGASSCAVFVIGAFVTSETRNSLAGWTTAEQTAEPQPTR